MKGSVKEPNKFHIYETEKITRKASDEAEYIDLFSSFTRDHHAQSSIKFIISVAHCRLDFTKNGRKNTSAMLNVNTTKITIVDETRECLSRQMMLTYSV